MCSNAYFGFFTGGGHFWRVTQVALQSVAIANILG